MVKGCCFAAMGVSSSPYTRLLLGFPEAHEISTSLSNSEAESMQEFNKLFFLWICESAFTFGGPHL
jgi:hypothetical protein